jgi:hypothetical protein
MDVGFTFSLLTKTMFKGFMTELLEDLFLCLVIYCFCCLRWSKTVCLVLFAVLSLSEFWK